MPILGIWIYYRVLHRQAGASCYACVRSGWKNATNFQSVIRQPDIFGQGGLCGFVFQVVAHMGEKSAFGTSLPEAFQRLLHAEMSGMRPVAQSIQNHHINRADNLHGGGRDAAAVGNIDD